MAIVINGSGTVTGITAQASDIELTDSTKLKLGTGDDLEVYHDGSDSIIADTGTGDLLISGSGTVRIDGSGETMINCADDGAVTLYHNNIAKIATTATGVTVTGGVVSTQPAFAMRSTATQATASGTHTLLALDAAAVDTVSGCTTGASAKYTIAAGYAGKYAIHASIRYTDATTGQSFRLYKNGSVLNRGGSGAMNYGLGSYNADLSFSCVVDLAVDDYIQVYAWNQAGGTSQGSSDGWCRASFSGYRLSV